MMDIEQYIDKVCIVELYSDEKHEGVVERIDDPEQEGWIRIRSGSEYWGVPITSIVKITPIKPMTFIYRQ